MQKKKYEWILKGFFLIIFVTMAYSLLDYALYPLSEALLVAFRQNVDYYAVDSIHCLVGTVLFFLVYLQIHKKESSVYTLSEDGVNFTLMTFLSTVISLGMGGVSGLWMDFAYNHLYENEIIGSSLESFDHTWSDLDTSPYFFVLLSVVLLGPILEELMFRGIIQKQLRKHFRFPIPLIVTALAFGIWHREPVQVVYTAMMGLIIGIVYDYTKNMFFPIYIHVLNNFLSSLPAPWQTDTVYYLIHKISSILILPSIFLCIYMCIQIYTRDKAKSLQHHPA